MRVVPSKAKTKEYFFPTEGDLVCFPSWLVHNVPSHWETETRVAFAANLQGQAEKTMKSAYAAPKKILVRLHGPALVGFLQLSTATGDGAWDSWFHTAVGWS